MQRFSFRSFLVDKNCTDRVNVSANMIICLMIIVLTTIQRTHCYKGVMLAPGVAFEMQTIQNLSDFIKQKHPGTDVVIATFANGKLTQIPMWKQVHEIYKDKNVTKFLKRNPDGFHIVAHSQGSLISRALIEYYGLTVINFITGAGIHMGYYGYLGRWEPSIEKYHLQNVVNTSVKHLSLILNTAILQHTLFLAGFWRDPCRMKSYLKHNKFLPVINNEVHHKDAQKFKNNFSNISKLYMFDGPDDGVVAPWQSGHFEFITCNGSAVKTTDLWVYKNDSFGLRTLFERNAVFHQEVPHVQHYDFGDVPFVEKYILSLLT